MSIIDMIMAGQFFFARPMYMNHYSYYDYYFYDYDNSYSFCALVVLTRAQKLMIRHADSVLF